jgi:hypothetical protein
MRRESAIRDFNSGAICPGQIGNFSHRNFSRLAVCFALHFHSLAKTRSFSKMLSHVTRSIRIRAAVARPLAPAATRALSTPPPPPPSGGAGDDEGGDGIGARIRRF